MTEAEFLKTLPESTSCEVCNRPLLGVRWTVNRYMENQSQWVGIGIVKCHPCSFVRMAAAGTDHSSHQYAQQLRRTLLTAMGQVH